MVQVDTINIGITSKHMQQLSCTQHTKVPPRSLTFECVKLM